MADLSLIFGQKDKGVTVGLVRMDASLEETHDKSVAVTEHPIEDGSNITDHIRTMPEQINITGMVSNTPIVFLASTRAPSPIKGKNRSRDRVKTAYEELRRIMNKGERVTVVTSLRKYENMVLQNLTVSRNVQLGNVLHADMTLREIQIAETSSVPLPKPEGKGNESEVNRGTQSKTAADAANSVKASDKISGLKQTRNFVVGAAKSAF